MQLRLLCGMLFCFVTVGFLQAQDCAKKLEQAQIAYKDGKIEMIPELLDSQGSRCLDGNGLTNNEKTNAYRLLALTYLYLNERPKAEEMMRRFLVLNPEYKINSSVDPPEFAELHATFRTHPVFLIGAKLGGNVIGVNVMKTFSVDKSDIARGEYLSRLGYQAGVTLELPLNNKMTIVGEAYLASRTYEFKDVLLNFANLTFRENQTWIDIPVLFKYYFTETKVRPFIQVGPSINLLFGSSANAKRIDIVDSETQREVSGPAISLKEQRNLFNFGVSGGGGFRFDKLIGNGSLLLEVRYNYALNNIVKTENRTKNHELIYDYGYIDNDFKVNNISFSMGYIIPIYNPKVIGRKKDFQYNF